MKTLSILVAVAILNLFTVFLVLYGQPVLALLSPQQSVIITQIPEKEKPSPTNTVISQKPKLSPKKISTPTSVPDPTPDSPPPQAAEAVVPTEQPAPQPVDSLPPQPTDAPPDPLAGRCIIVIDGGSYDVTDYRSQHSGGDVFTCGADLSQMFHDRHPNSFLNKMAKFRV